MIILASGSAARTAMLTAAGVGHRAVTPRIDEETVKAALLAEGAGPRDIADALAESKARKVARKHPEAMVLGSDQVLALDDRLLGKPGSPEDAVAQLAALSGRRHALFSAAVVYDAGRPVWRHVAEVRLHVRALSDGYLSDYVDRNWDRIRHSAGGYLIEGEAARFFTRIEGDHFAVLGMPLLEVLGYLVDRGRLRT